MVKTVVVAILLIAAPALAQQPPGGNYMPPIPPAPGQTTPYPMTPMAPPPPKPQSEGQLPPRQQWNDCHFNKHHQQVCRQCRLELGRTHCGQARIIQPPKMQ
jgi:hypothetical protein